jgi:hypothetical protein
MRLQVRIESRSLLQVGRVYVGLKQDINIQSAATDFSFETEEVTALYLTMKVEHAVQNVYQIHKKIYCFSY